ncbi:MAG TPA: hypothetical protein VGJ18_14365 [Gemmatimonadaceae bacterium]|jgi:hypothetical protein
MRQIRDDAGVEWMVYEVNPVAGAWRSVESLPEGYRNGWLCFESPTEKRRLTPLPSGWEELPIDQLARLLGSAALVLRAVQQYGHPRRA